MARKAFRRATRPYAGSGFFSDFITFIIQEYTSCHDRLGSSPHPVPKVMSSAHQAMEGAPGKVVSS